MDNETLFVKKFWDMKLAVNFMIKLAKSPHHTIHCIDYYTDFEYDSDLRYWYGRQIHYIMPRINEILGWKNYKRKEKK